MRGYSLVAWRSACALDSLSRKRNARQARYILSNMIHVEHLTKSFRDLRRGSVRAVDDVSFDAGPGEVFGLLGPNGAGKTTTLRILCTVLKPTSGVATVAGYDVVAQAGQVRHTVGFLSATTGVYERMTAREMVTYYGRLHGIEGAQLRARVNEL